jgi:lipoprotein signal peptidase
MRNVRVAVVLALLVIADVVVDLTLSGRAGTLHHQRPAVVVIPVLLLGLCLWQTAHQLGRLGQIGALIALTGATGNAVCALADRQGVADYLYLTVGQRMVVFNVADLALAIGFALVLVSVCALWASRAWRLAGG